jgi:hypothetical protein
MALNVHIKPSNSWSDDYDLPGYFTPKLYDWLHANFNVDKDYRQWGTVTHYCYEAKAIHHLPTRLEFYNLSAMNLFLTIYGEFYERKDKWL